MYFSNSDHYEQLQSNQTDNQLTTLDYANFLRGSELESSFIVYRCTNPVPPSVESFIESVTSLKVDFAKTLLVFATQYFIPLSMAAVLYIRIGKTIQHQGKIANLRGKVK